VPTAEQRLRHLLAAVNHVRLPIHNFVFRRNGSCGASIAVEMSLNFHTLIVLLAYCDTGQNKSSLLCLLIKLWWIAIVRCY